MAKKYTGDAGVSQNHEKGRERMERGYDGVVPDPTPNFNYTVAGNDAPTPETDRELKAAADARSREIEEAYSDVRPLPGAVEEPSGSDSDNE